MVDIRWTRFNRKPHLNRIRVMIVRSSRLFHILLIAQGLQKVDLHNCHLLSSETLLPACQAARRALWADLPSTKQH